jgi:hypothetical protein
MQTARDLADRVVAAQKEVWEKTDPTVAIVATEQLNCDDVSVVNRIVAAAGFTGEEGDEMIRKVKSLVVGQVEAQSDNLPSEST